MHNLHVREEICGGSIHADFILIPLAVVTGVETWSFHFLFFYVSCEFLILTVLITDEISIKFSILMFNIYSLCY